MVKLLFKTWIRDKTSIFFGILFPVMLLLVFGSIFGGPSPPNFTLYVRNLDVDENNKPNLLSTAFIGALNNSGVFEVILLKPGDPYPRSTGFYAIRILTIPNGFTNNLLNMTMVNRIDITVDTIIRMVEMAGERIPEETRANITSSMQGMQTFKEFINASKSVLTLEGSRDDRVLQSVETIINIIASKFELALLNASSAIELKTVYSEVRQMRVVDYYLPGYVAAFIMSNGVIGVSSMVSDMNRRHILKLLASTPVSKAVWILSLLVVQTFASLMLTAVMIMVGWLVFRITAIPDAFSLMVIFIGTVAFTGFGILIGGAIKEAEAVTALGNAIAFPMMFLSGAFWPVELMPSFLQQIAQFVPLYYFHSALRQTLIAGSVETALLPITIVLTMAVIGILLAIATTKWRDF